ncbi:unnamed protein product [Euphydryas editha]|uniref:Uncharacterized protein n=1 Tax=Euphydryas editha TaxID=104508 RepID=A0AAU9V9P4_EUPED|nr:unnamed protein product [Euphydryas editha]
MQIYVDVENENRKEDCKIYSTVEKCCLTDSEEEDCDTIDIYSDKFDTIKPKDRKTFIHVLPTPYQHDLIGYCEIILIIHCPMTQEKLKIQIPFDTKIRKESLPLFKDYVGNNKPIVCDTLDQNPLDECSPTNCDIKYFDRRPFYDLNVKRCIKAPICVGDIDTELPDIVYDPKVNICKDLSSPLSFRDIYSMSTGIGTVVATVKPDLVKVSLKRNCTTISQNLLFLKDLMYGKLFPHSNNEEINYKDDCKSAIFSILINIISVCALLFSFVCCVNTIVWVQRQWLNGNIGNLIKKIRSKFKRTKTLSRKPRNRKKVRNALLRDVVVNDVPLKLRSSVISICNRIEKEVHKKNRYRKSDIGSQISLQKNRSTSQSTNSSSDEEDSERHPPVK